MRINLARGFLVLAAAALGLSGSGAARAALQNPGFESTSDWTWSTTSHGDYVTKLDLTPNTNFVPPYAQTRFGYAENSGSANPVSISQLNAVVDGNYLEFWYFFFTNEAEEAGKNDQLDVTVVGGGAVFQTIDQVSTASFGNSFQPLVTPGPASGQAQSFGRYTAWTHYLLDVSSLIGNTVSVSFTVRDGSGGHTESSGFGLDNVQFVPEPASMGLIAAGGLLLLRRRKA